jgi:hypothetical protein
VTVVIPCFNQGRYLSAALRSVQRQSYGGTVETVVVDDGSTDNTADEARRAGVVLVSQPNLGVSMARNAGMRVARGDYIIFLDADDELMPDAVASGAAALAARPDVSCVVRRCQSIDSESRLVPTTHPAVDHDDLYGEWLQHNFVWTPGAAVFRRQSLEAIGGFAPNIDAAADYRLYLALSRTGAVVYDERDAVLHRQHDGNMSADPALMLRMTLAALRLERPMVPEHRRTAFEHGQKRWKAHYGEQILEQLRRNPRGAARRGWDLEAAWTLLRHCPQLLVRRGATKLFRTIAATPAMSRLRRSPLLSRALRHLGS